MNDVVYIKVNVRHVSLETYNDDGEMFGDEGIQMAKSAGEYDKEYFLNLLTKRQKAVAELLFNGYDRVRIATSLGVSVQAVHQIVPRIRKRLNEKAGIPLKGWKRRHGGY